MPEVELVPFTILVTLTVASISGLVAAYFRSRSAEREGVRTRAHLYAALISGGVASFCTINFARAVLEDLGNPRIPAGEWMITATGGLICACAWVVVVKCAVRAKRSQVAKTSRHQRV
jgi:hypothetical protein